ncbi:MAG: peroxiredoxin [Thiolinea sp.]
MTLPVVGEAVSDFSAAMTSQKTFTLSDFRSNKNIVLYFYPKDSTPGCTTEGQDFRDNYTAFQELDTEIFGISRDGLKAHENFRTKQSFPFELISDKDEAVCDLFDVIKMKNMYGKQVRGIERSTFIIDKSGILRQEWRKVRVKDHVANVLEAVRSL